MTGVLAATLLLAAQDPSGKSTIELTCAEALEPSRHREAVVAVSGFATGLNLLRGRAEAVTFAEAEQLVADKRAICASDSQMIYRRAITAAYNRKYLAPE